MQRGTRGSGVNVDPERVRQARVEAGLTLAQVAGDDVSRTLIHLVEHGRARPSPAVVNLIAKRTGKPAEFFLLEGASEVKPIALTAELHRVAKQTRELAGREGLTRVEISGLRILEAALERGFELVRSIEARATTWRPQRRSNSRRRAPNNPRASVPLAAAQHAKHRDNKRKGPV